MHFLTGKIEKTLPETPTEWCAFAPGKGSRKRDGNFFTAEELREMDNSEGILLYQPLPPVLCAE